MTHTFKFGNPTNPALCAECQQNITAHIPGAKRCVICNEVKSDIKLHAPSGREMCWSCTDKHIGSLIKDISDSASEARDIIAQAKDIDKSINYNGDLYNAKVVAIIDIKKAIDSDDTLDEPARLMKFQSALAERFKHLQDVVFKLDNEKHDVVLEQLAISKTLRDYGNDLRKEIREQLKNNDNNYQPLAKPVAKPKLAKKTPEQRIIEAIAMARGISYEEAKKLMAAGGLK